MSEPFRGRIGRRVAMSFLGLVAIVVGSFGWAFYDLIRTQLERQMNAHLIGVAQLVAEGLDGDVVLGLRPEYSLYRRLRLQLIRARDLVDARRIYVFEREGRFLIDTASEAVVGIKYPRLAFDRSEVDRVWLGKPAYSVRFRDERGVDYQTGYAPVYSGNEVVAVVGVEIGVGFVEEVRAFVRGTAILAAIAAGVTIGLGFLLGRSVTGPVARLVEAAKNIGKGNLVEPVMPPSKDELGYLGQTMEEMRKGLLVRDESLRQMLAGVAHEIRNPLGGIELHAGLIASDLACDDPRRKLIEKVIAEVRNLDRVITEFLTFARPPKANPEAIDMAEIIADVGFLLAPEMDRAGVFYKSDIEADAIVYADAGQVKRALINLMKNAVQAMPDGGKLWVGCWQEASQVVVVVRDTGNGIAEEDLPHLFEPFFSTREQGSGLGLAIVKQVVEENGGRILVESVLGKGATFQLLLPREGSL